MFGIGIPELIVIGIIILLIFGAKRLPSIGENLGKTVQELRNVKKEIQRVNKPEAQEEDSEGIESEVKKETADGVPDSSEGRPFESDIVDTVQKKVTEQVTDRLLKTLGGHQ